MAGRFFKNPVVSADVLERLLKTTPVCAPLTPEQKPDQASGLRCLINQCDWKGKVLGGTAVHRRQALVNRGCTGGKKFAPVQEDSPIGRKALWNCFTAGNTGNGRERAFCDGPINLID
jgi:hypothetical protein